jgi:hypothetical protein
MFLLVYDPETDFTVQPWLKQKFGGGLRLGEAVGGNYVSVPAGEQNIRFYGYLVTLKANLEPTGTGLDQSMHTLHEIHTCTCSSVTSAPVLISEIFPGRMADCFMTTASGG